MNAKIRNAILLSCTAAFPAVVWAQQAPPAAGTLEEIVITAQKRPEKLQEVPVAASVLSSDFLTNANAGDITDLNNLVPSVNLNATINGRVPLGMRGISSNANEGTVGLASGVAIMVDGVPVPSDSQGGNQLEDLERVEVLKGPQATLGGRTAAAGVINIVTRGPTDHFTASVGATATTDDEYRVNGFLAGPVADRADFSLSAYGNTRDYPIRNLQTGKFTYQETHGVRGKLRLKPTDNLDITFSGRVAEANSYGFNFVYKYVTPGAYLLFGTNPPPTPPGAPPNLWDLILGQGTLLPGIKPGWDNQQYGSPVAVSAKIRDVDAGMNIEYRVGDLTLTSTTALQTERQTNIQDLFAVATYFFTNLTQGAAPFDNTQTQFEQIRQFSEELKLASPADRAFSYLFGAFYSDSSVNLHEIRGLAPAALNTTTRPETKTYDVYGRGTWAFTPSNSVVLGLRYNSDKLSYSTDQIVNVPYGPASSSGSDTSSAFVGDVSLQHKFDANSMVYATVARGYAPKAYNTALALADNSPITPVDQEHINHIELGSKGFYLDRHLSLNVALFDTIYKDYQIQTFSNDPRYLAPPLYLVSAGKAETRGLEVDTVWAATDALRVSLSAAYIDAKFKDYKGAPCVVGQTAAQGCAADGTQDVSGRPMPNSPKFKATLGLEQRFPLSIGADLILGGTYSYRSSAQMLPDQNPEAVQPAFGLLNLTATLRSNSGKLSVAVFANNVTDHHYAGDVEDFWAAPWGSNNVVIQPARDSSRYFGVRANVGF